MLSHENVVAGMCAVILQLGDHRPRSDDIMMSFLPLAHMLERCCEVSELYQYGRQISHVGQNYDSVDRK